MGRVILLLLIAVVILAVLLLPRSKDARLKQSAGWIKAGGILGLLVIISRMFCVPLATLLYYLPFVIPSFRRAAGEQHAQPSQASMTPKEARLILGVRDGADMQEIKDAHKKLITRNHPDKGGSDYLAAKINEARDVLLK